MNKVLDGFAIAICIAVTVVVAHFVAGLIIGAMFAL